MLPLFPQDPQGQPQDPEAKRLEELRRKLSQELSQNLQPYLEETEGMVHPSGRPAGAATPPRPGVAQQPQDVTAQPGAAKAEGQQTPPPQPTEGPGSLREMQLLGHEELARRMAPAQPGPAGPIAPGGAGVPRIDPLATPLENLYALHGPNVPPWELEATLKKMRQVLRQRSQEETLAYGQQIVAQGQLEEYAQQRAQEQSREQLAQQLHGLQMSMLLQPHRIQDPEWSGQIEEQIHTLGPKIDPEDYQALQDRFRRLSTYPKIQEGLRNEALKALYSSLRESHQRSREPLGQLGLAGEGALRGLLLRGPVVESRALQSVREALGMVVEPSRGGKLSSTSSITYEPQPAEPWYGTPQPTRSRRDRELGIPEDMPPEVAQAMKADAALQAMQRMMETDLGSPANTIAEAGNLLGMLVPLGGGGRLIERVAGKALGEGASAGAKILRKTLSTGGMVGVGSVAGYALPLDQMQRTALEAAPPGKKDEIEEAMRLQNASALGVILPFYGIAARGGGKIGELIAGGLHRARVPGGIASKVGGALGGAGTGALFPAAGEVGGMAVDRLAEGLKELGLEGDTLQAYLDMQAVRAAGPTEKVLGALTEGDVKSAVEAMSEYADHIGVPMSVFGALGVARGAGLRFGRDEYAEVFRREAVKQIEETPELTEVQKDHLKRQAVEAAESMKPEPEAERRAAAGEALEKEAGGREEAGRALSEQEILRNFAGGEKARSVEALREQRRAEIERAETPEEVDRLTREETALGYYEEALAAERRGETGPAADLRIRAEQLLEGVPRGTSRSDLPGPPGEQELRRTAARSIERDVRREAEGVGLAEKAARRLREGRVDVPLPEGLREPVRRALGLEQRVRTIRLSGPREAEQFLERFGDRLPEEQRRQIQDFAQRTLPEGEVGEVRPQVAQAAGLPEGTTRITRGQAEAALPALEAGPQFSAAALPLGPQGPRGAQAARQVAEIRQAQQELAKLAGLPSLPDITPTPGTPRAAPAERLSLTEAQARALGRTRGEKLTVDEARRALEEAPEATSPGDRRALGNLRRKVEEAGPGPSVEEQRRGRPAAEAMGLVTEREREVARNTGGSIAASPIRAQMTHRAALEGLETPRPKPPEGGWPEVPPRPRLENAQPLDLAEADALARLEDRAASYANEFGARQREVSPEEAVEWLHRQIQVDELGRPEGAPISFRGELADFREAFGELESRIEGAPANVRAEEIDLFLRRQRGQLGGAFSVSLRYHPEGPRMLERIEGWDGELTEFRRQHGALYTGPARNGSEQVQDWMAGAEPSWMRNVLRRLLRGKPKTKRQELYGFTLEGETATTPRGRLRDPLNWIRTAAGAFRSLGKDMALGMERSRSDIERMVGWIETTVEKKLHKSGGDPVRVTRMLRGYHPEARAKDPEAKRAWEEATDVEKEVAHDVRAFLNGPARQSSLRATPGYLRKRRLRRHLARQIKRTEREIERLEHEEATALDIAEAKRPREMEEREQLLKVRKRLKNRRRSRKTDEEREEVDQQIAEVEERLMEVARSIREVFEEAQIPWLLPGQKAGETPKGTLRDPFTAATALRGPKATRTKLRTREEALARSIKEFEEEAWRRGVKSEPGVGDNYVPRVYTDRIARERTFDVLYEDTRRPQERSPAHTKRRVHEEAPPEREVEEDIGRLLYFWTTRSLPQMERNRFLFRWGDTIYGRERLVNEAELKAYQRPQQMFFNGIHEGKRYENKEVRNHGEYLIVEREGRRALVRNEEMTEQERGTLAEEQKVRAEHRIAGIRGGPRAPRKVVVLDARETGTGQKSLPADPVTRYERLSQEGEVMLVPAREARSSLWVREGGFHQLMTEDRWVQFRRHLRRYIGLTDEMAGLDVPPLLARAARNFGHFVSASIMGMGSPRAALNAAVGAVGVYNARMLGYRESFAATEYMVKFLSRLRRLKMTDNALLAARFEATDVDNPRLFMDRYAERVRTPKEELEKMSPRKRQLTEWLDDAMVDALVDPTLVGTQAFTGFTPRRPVRPEQKEKPVFLSGKRKALRHFNPFGDGVLGWGFFQTFERVVRQHLYLSVHTRSRENGYSREAARRLAQNAVFAAHGVLNNVAKSPMMASGIGQALGPVTNWMQHISGVHMRMMKPRQGLGAKSWSGAGIVEFGKIWSQSAMLSFIGQSLGLDWTSQVGASLDDIPFLGPFLERKARGLGRETEDDPRGEKQKPFIDFGPVNAIRDEVSSQVENLPLGVGTPLAKWLRFVTGDFRDAVGGTLIPVMPVNITSPVVDMGEEMVRFGGYWSDGDTVNMDKSAARIANDITPRLVTDISRVAALEEDPKQPGQYLHRQPTLSNWLYKMGLTDERPLVGKVEYRVPSSGVEHFLVSQLGLPIERGASYLESAMNRELKDVLRTKAAGMGEVAASLIHEITTLPEGSAAAQAAAKRLDEHIEQMFRDGWIRDRSELKQKIGLWTRYSRVRQQMDRRQGEIITAYDKHHQASLFAHHLTLDRDPLTRHEAKQVVKVLGGKQGFAQWLKGLGRTERIALIRAMEAADERWRKAPEGQ